MGSATPAAILSAANSLYWVRPDVTRFLGLAQRTANGVQHTREIFSYKREDQGQVRCDYCHEAFSDGPRASVCRPVQWILWEVLTMGFRGLCKQNLTVTISIQRRVAEIITSNPLLNRIMRPIFFPSLRPDDQSIGIGIDNKYKSVNTLKARQTHTIWLDIAG